MDQPASCQNIWETIQMKIFHLSHVYLCAIAQRTRSLCSWFESECISLQPFLGNMFTPITTRVWGHHRSGKDKLPINYLELLKGLSENKFKIGKIILHWLHEIITSYSLSRFLVVVWIAIYTVLVSAFYLLCILYLCSLYTIKALSKCFPQFTSILFPKVFRVPTVWIYVIFLVLL